MRETKPCGKTSTKTTRTEAINYRVMRGCLVSAKPNANCVKGG